eukprot:1321992-Rhodomonas_salina.1
MPMRRYYPRPQLIAATLLIGSILGPLKARRMSAAVQSALYCLVERGPFFTQFQYSATVHGTNYGAANSTAGPGNNAPF